MTTSTEEDSEDNTMIVREMVNEFLKILFCSTKYGINFYDKTLNLDMSARNYNHLIFNTLISLPRFGLKNPKTCVINRKTNELIDELTLRTLKVCPDLIQRFLKVKQKQEANKTQTGENWFIQFCTQLFDQQQMVIRSMAKNPTGTSSYLRSVSQNETNSSNLADLLISIVIHMSIPLCISFQKLLSPLNQTTEVDTQKQDSLLRLLIACLKCLKEWKQCLEEISQFDFKQLISEDLSKKDVYENLKRIFDRTNKEKFQSKLNLELTSKYLPKFDVFSNLKATFSEENNSIMHSFDIFTLYFNIFSNQKQKQLSAVEDEESSFFEEDTFSERNCLNLLEVNKLEKSLTSIVPKLLKLDEHEDTNDSSSNSDHLVLARKYFNFLVNYTSLKQSELVYDANENDEMLHDSNKIVEMEVNRNSVLFSFVKTLNKFKAESDFKALVTYYLRFLEIYFGTGSQMLEFDHDYVYMWLLIARNSLVSHTDKSSVLIDFFYVCLNNFLDSRKRDSILFKIELENSNQNHSSNFNQLFIFICLKSFQSFRKEKSGADINDESMIFSFMTEYILNSTLILADSRSTLNQSPVESFKALFSSPILCETAENTELMRKFANDLDKKLVNVRTMFENKQSVKVDEVDLKIETYSQAFMICFQSSVRFKSKFSNSGGETNIEILYLNLNLRARHLLYLMNLLFNKVSGFKLKLFINII